MLDVDARIEDPLVPPGSPLEAVRGDLRGLHSIRLNDQWRIVFRWSDGNASEVHIVDDHCARTAMPRTQSARHGPVHPGEILHEELLVPLGISMYRLAKDTGVAFGRCWRRGRRNRIRTATMGFACSRERDAPPVRLKWGSGSPRRSGGSSIGCRLR